ncbi:hypothetical protein ElyMa_001945800 [Elysia marginata]|uniref:Uncharacterized protein n=1 Tax=Elysia marginata TaxID=1093978 RepID=A0AAV4EXC6_9GAST|nr:hypothetical protein ElyMa_001945800 [Elysia marginata]
MPTPMSIPTCPSVVVPTTAVNPYTPTPLVSVESTVSPFPTVDTRMTDVSPHTPLPVAAVKSTASKSAPRTSRESGGRSSTQGTETEALRPVPEEGWYNSAGGASCV